MNKLKISSRMHVMVIVSAVILALGVAIGLVCEFVFGGYFNYGAEYSSYKSVEVNYALIDSTAFGGAEGVKELCDVEFDGKGVAYYTSAHAETNDGWQYVFRFSANADEKALASAVSAIHARLSDSSLSGISGAYLHNAVTQKGNTEAYKFGAIALASAVVFQFIYFAVRYKLTMAFAALLANVHNFALFISLVTLTRVPVGSQVVVFGVLTVLLTMIGCAFLFERVRKSLKDEGFAKLGVNEQVDTCVGESLFGIALSSVGVAAAAAVVFALLSVSALSVTAVITPVALAVLSAASAFYGTAFFTPSVYSRFKKTGDEFKEKHSGKATKKA